MEKKHKASIYMKLDKVFSFQPPLPHLCNEINGLYSPFQIL